jgi:hypothetical protein
MELSGDSITSWDNMKRTFLGKYQYYFRLRDEKEEFFKMYQKEEERL